MALLRRLERDRGSRYGASVSRERRIRQPIARDNWGLHTLEIEDEVSWIVDKTSISPEVNLLTSDEKSKIQDNVVRYLSEPPVVAVVSVNDYEEEEEEDSVCVICFDLPPDDNLALYPCGHCNMCTSCATTVYESNTPERRICPECRVRIAKLFHLFRTR